MARSVFSKRLLAVQGLTLAVSASPPAGFRWVIRDIETYCNAPLAGQRFTIMGELGQAIWTSTTAPNTTAAARITCHIVVMEGTSFSVKADQPTDVTISGYELSLP